MEVVGRENSSLFVKNSYRYVIYNTLQHDKSKLKLGVEGFSQQAIVKSIEKSLENLKNLSEYISKSSLRTEVYVEIRKPADIQQAFRSICPLNSMIKIVRIKKNILKQVLKGRIKAIRMLLDYQRLYPSDPNIGTFVVLVFGKFLACLLSSEKISNSFLGSSYGFFFPFSCFDFNDYTLNFNTTFFNYMSPSSLYQVLEASFNTSFNEQFEEKVSFFNFLCQSINEESLKLRYLELYSTKVVALLKSKSIKCSSSARIQDRQFVTIDNFLEIASNHYRSECMKDIVKSLEEMRHCSFSTFSSICSRLISSKVSILVQSTLYIADHWAKISQGISMTRLSEFACSIPFGSLSLESLSLSENRNILALISELEERLLLFFEKLRAKYSLDFEIPIFFEVLMRCIFFQVPSSETLGEELVLGLTLFKDLSDFMEFVFHVMLTYSNKLAYTKALRKVRDSISVLETPLGTKWSIVKLQYFTGAFSLANKVSRDCLQVPLPMKIKISKPLPSDEMLPLLSSTRRLVQQPTTSSKLQSVLALARGNIFY